MFICDRFLFAATKNNSWFISINRLRLQVIIDPASLICFEWIKRKQNPSIVYRVDAIFTFYWQIDKVSLYSFNYHSFSNGKVTYVVYANRSDGSWNTTEISIKPINRVEHLQTSNHFDDCVFRYYWYDPFVSAIEFPLKGFLKKKYKTCDLFI